MDNDVCLKVIRIGNEELGKAVDVRRGFWGSKYSEPRKIGLYEYFDDFVTRHRRCDIESIKDLYEFVEQDVVQFQMAAHCEYVHAFVASDRESESEKKRLAYKGRCARRLKKILEREFCEELK